MRKIGYILVLCAVVFLGACKTQTPQQKAQEQAHKKAMLVQDEAANLKKIQTGNFSFYPNTVEPEFGITHLLDCSCFLQVNHTTMKAQLPFLGHFYLSSRPFSLEPLFFLSSDLTYEYSTQDNIVYDVIVTPLDAESLMNQGLVFNMKLNKKTGNATLVVKSDTTQPITYTGYFE